MTSGIGVLVEDAGYHSEANLTAPGPDRLIADGKTRDLARREPADGPPPEGATAAEANAHRLATPEGRAAYKRRAPDVEGLHASLKDQGGLRRFSLRGLHNATSEFLFAGLAAQPPAAGRHQLKQHPPPGRAPQPGHTTPANSSRTGTAPRRKARARPTPAPALTALPVCPSQETATAPIATETAHDHGVGPSGAAGPCQRPVRAEPTPRRRQPTLRRRGAGRTGTSRPRPAPPEWAAAG